MNLQPNQAIFSSRNVHASQACWRRY